MLNRLWCSEGHEEHKFYYTLLAFMRSSDLHLVGDMPDKQCHKGEEVLEPVYTNARP
jgi:hypothetical protein